MTSEALFIHFDGMDLAGKSIAVNNFAKESGLDWEIRYDRLSEVNPIHTLAKSLRVEGLYNSEIIGNLYYTALMADIDRFQRPTKNTIQESTIILRSIAFHTVENTPKLANMFEDLLKRHPIFDASFILTADIEHRKERLKKRMKETPEKVTPRDMLIITNPEKFLAMESCLVNMAVKGFGSKVINTSNLTPEGVTEIVVANVPIVRNKILDSHTPHC